MVKVDIRKTYETIEWSFVMQALEGFGFSKKFRQVIYACILSSSFSIFINGNQEGWIESRRGIR